MAVNWNMPAFALCAPDYYCHFCLTLILIDDLLGGVEQSFRSYDNTQKWNLFMGKVQRRGYLHAAKEVRKAMANYGQEQQYFPKINFQFRQSESAEIVSHTFKI